MLRSADCVREYHKSLAPETIAVATAACTAAVLLSDRTFLRKSTNQNDELTLLLLVVANRSKYREIRFAREAAPFTIIIAVLRRLNSDFGVPISPELEGQHFLQYCTAQQSPTMTISVCLEPQHKQGEVLRSDAPQRPVVCVPTDGSILTLGKNSTTQIADSGLKRKCVSLQLRNQNQLIVFNAIPAQVSVNGILVEGLGPLLVAGDILTLHAPNIGYEFKVVVQGGSLSRTDKNYTPNSIALDIDEDQQHNTTSDLTGIPALATAHHPQESNAHTSRSAVAEELFCAFCLEILVCATTLVPCGHSFCHSCLVNVTECPTCRGTVQTTVHCRMVDNVIAAMVAQHHHPPPHGSVFAPDDVEKYHERSNQVVSPKKISATRSSARKRRKKSTGRIPEWVG